MSKGLHGILAPQFGRCSAPQGFARFIGCFYCSFARSLCCWLLEHCSGSSAQRAERAAQVSSTALQGSTNISIMISLICLLPCFSQGSRCGAQRLAPVEHCGGSSAQREGSQGPYDIHDTPPYLSSRLKDCTASSLRSSTAVALLRITEQRRSDSLQPHPRLCSSHPDRRRRHGPLEHIRGDIDRIANLRRPAQARKAPSSDFRRLAAATPTARSPFPGCSPPQQAPTKARRPKRLP